MLYKIIADMIVVLHFFWIIFMLLGFSFTIYGFFWKKFFDWWLFRTLHLSGILFVGLLTLLQRFCPLTILENLSRAKYSPDSTYPGSFIVHYIENLVYPDVNQTLLRLGTVLIAIFILVVYIIRPPKKIKKLLKKNH
ncbi:DUF2784 family protein [candidate division WOR-3 bacterium]|nr:DUF2784 family protein [candidate division WOR-3 bacterium]